MTNTGTIQEVKKPTPNPDRLPYDVAAACAARAAHEVNRAWCLAHGDASQPSWEDAPDWQRESALNGVRGVLDGNGPEASHESWMREKIANGWTFGPEKDPEAKTHPCLVPYAELPNEQRMKDGLYVTTVRAVLISAGFDMWFAFHEEAPSPPSGCNMCGHVQAADI